VAEEIKENNNIFDNKKIYQILLSLKYPFILFILFILICSPEFILVIDNISLIKILNKYWQYSSLLLKGILFVSMYKLLEILDKKSINEINNEIKILKKVLIEYKSSKKILDEYKNENKFLLEHKFNLTCIECNHNKKIHENINYMDKINELSEERDSL
jgi:hypothetical protein